MENCLIELKHDKVLKFFAETKKKYEEDYRKHSTEIEPSYIGYIIHYFIDGLIILSAVIGVIFTLHYIISNSDILYKIFTEDKIVEQTTNENILYIAFAVTSIIPVIYFWKRMLTRIVDPVTFRIPSRKIRVSKRKYYSEIRKDMIYYVRYNLSYSITEDMLIFDKTGLIIGPDLSKKENKKVFSEAERKLEQKNE